MDTPMEAPKTKMVPAITRRKVRAMYSRYRQLLKRYRRVGVKRRVKEVFDDYELITDERKARRRPDYAELADEDAEEEEDEILKDVWLYDEEAERKDRE